jgi:hypothetical protein
MTLKSTRFSIEVLADFLPAFDQVVCCSLLPPAQRLRIQSLFTMNVDKAWLRHLVTLLAVTTEQIKFPNRN